MTPLEKVQKRKEKIEKINKILEKEGYFVANLWHVNDVKSLYECTDKEAQEVLYEALTSDTYFDAAWEEIRYYADDKGLIDKDL